MAVLMIADVEHLTEDMYASMVDQMMPLLRAAQGFIAHAAGPGPDGSWRIVELWESDEDGQKWFDTTVKPTLPPSIVPNRNYYPLHTAFTR
jgi:heme-degrading monooxygenase HmoA